MSKDARASFRPNRIGRQRGVGKMFQVCTSPTRKTASALTVLAAIGASGMVAEVASADIIELSPTEAARGTKSSYMGNSHPENWVNWLADLGVTYHAKTE